MAVNRTCLSAGIAIREMLTSDDGVRAITENIFPVVANDKAVLPYIAYRRTQMASEAVKTGRPSDTAYIEVICYARGYTESIDLAEAVRGALDMRQYEGNGMRMRGCRMTDSDEGWADDAYMQQLIFEVKIYAESNI